MRLVLMFALSVAMPAIASAQAAQGWIADPRSGCRAWDNYPAPDDRIQWEGGCIGGYVEGHGTLQWFSKGENYETASGDFNKGMLEGHGTVEAKRGHFDGEFHGNRPNGVGSFRTKDGDVYSGAWSNGCFQQGNRRMTFYTTATECGF